MRFMLFVIIVGIFVVAKRKLWVIGMVGMGVEVGCGFGRDMREFEKRAHIWLLLRCKVQVM